MFGYAAPQIPKAGTPGAPTPGAPRPGTGPAPQPQPSGFAPPPQQGFAPPPGPQGGFPPPGGAPPAGGFNAPPPGGGFPPPGGQPGFGPPPGQQPGGFGGPPPGGGFGGPPPGNPGFGPPPGGPPPGGFGGPPPGGQPGFGGPPPGGQPGFGGPPPGGQPGFGGPPPGAPGGFGQQPGGYPQPQAFAPPQQDLPGPLDNMARGIPQSAPGTIFGFPVARLRDPGLQKTVLLIAGVALIASIVIPHGLKPTRFAWSEGMPKFQTLVWPIIAGALYLLVAAAPPNLKQNVPPIVLQWLPFAVSFVGIMISKLVYPDTLFSLGYATLVFGLLARIAQPNDQIARIIIAVGAGMLFPHWIDLFSVAFKFKGQGALNIISGLLHFIVITIGVLCVLFVVPPQKLPPALKAVDAFGPLVAAILIVWLPVLLLLMTLGLLVHAKAGVGAILMLAHGLLNLVAFFGVLMMTSPAAYEEAKAMFAKGGGGGGGGGYPPPGGGGGYPPPGGGYPPPGGGYPPPQGGGYPPPQGGGFPPPQGGGYPPQGGGGGGWPQ